MKGRATEREGGTEEGREIERDLSAGSLPKWLQQQAEAGKSLGLLLVSQSIILPVYNAEPWLDECLSSVLQQDFEGALELSVFNDASQDKSMTIIEKWKEKLEESGILVVVGGHSSSSPRGVGYSKNQAIAQSSGSYLCFLDSDDVMMPQRVRLQHEAAAQHPTSIIGCQVRREPPNSTERYTRWVNQLAPDQLLTQVFTSHGPTVIMPTWFCSRAWFSHVGPFEEGGQGEPEDLLFFYQHLRKGGGVVRVDQSLLLYRYHPQAVTHSILETSQGASLRRTCGRCTCSRAGTSCTSAESTALQDGPVRAPTGTEAEAMFAKSPQWLPHSGHTASVRYACFRNRPVVCIPRHPGTHTDSPLQVWQSRWLHTCPS
nr:UDP-GlcNAc:betaGal beta-1,3-N-acetylglucosaminyltransferase-like protein 1 isoform X5 [Oryctolagus cuniculus]